MGHYRSALSNWLRGRRRRRESGAATSRRPDPSPPSPAPPPPLPPTRAPCGYESAASDASLADAWASSGAGPGSARERRSLSDSAVLQAPSSSPTNLRHLRSFQAVGAASHVSSWRLAQLPRADAAPTKSQQHRRSTWASRQDGPAAPTPVFEAHEPHLSQRRFHLSRHLSRRKSRPHAHQSPRSPDASVALTPGPSIIFIEC